jgi:hypothetical protein
MGKSANKDESSKIAPNNTSRINDGVDNKIDNPPSSPKTKLPGLTSKYLDGLLSKLNLDKDEKVTPLTSAELDAILSELESPNKTTTRAQEPDQEPNIDKFINTLQELTSNPQELTSNPSDKSYESLRKQINLLFKKDCNKGFNTPNYLVHGAQPATILDAAKYVIEHDTDIQARMENQHPFKLMCSELMNNITQILAKMGMVKEGMKQGGFAEKVMNQNSKNNGQGRG